MRTAMIQCGIPSGHLRSPETLDLRACSRFLTICLEHMRLAEALDLCFCIHLSTVSALYIAINTP